jgi:hypothetical protein
MIKKPRAGGDPDAGPATRLGMAGKRAAWLNNGCGAMFLEFGDTKKPRSERGGSERGEEARLAGGEKLSAPISQHDQRRRVPSACFYGPVEPAAASWRRERCREHFTWKSAITSRTGKEGDSASADFIPCFAKNLSTRER